MKDVDPKDDNMITQDGELGLDSDQLEEYGEMLDALGAQAVSKLYASCLLPSMMNALSFFCFPPHANSHRSLLCLSSWTTGQDQNQYAYHDCG